MKPLVGIFPGGQLFGARGRDAMTALFAGGLLRTAEIPAPAPAPTPALPAFTTAKYDGDSRTASMGSRGVASGSLTLSGGFGTAPNAAGFLQAVCGNRWLQREGYQHAIGGSTTRAMEARSKTTAIVGSGNPAQGDTGNSADALFSTGSDGVATVLTQSGRHVFSASVSVNDGSGSQGAYYNNPQVASQTLRTIARYADALGAAGICWTVGNELPRGLAAYQMESRAVSGGTATASRTTDFIDGESYGATGVIGIFASGNPRALTKVASAPGQDQYTVSAAGAYVFGGTAPTSVLLTYSATPPSHSETSIHNRVVNEWCNSAAPNFVSSVNGVDYGIAGLQYQRPLVRVANTFDALLDASTGGKRWSLPGTMDSLELHHTALGAYRAARAFKARVDADYPDAPSLDCAPTRNNWFAARGTATGTAFSGTLPPSMRIATPTLVSVNGVVLGKVDTATGAISGTGITIGSLNFATGAWNVTFDAASRMPANAQLWFEQDIGNFDVVAMGEGTIGRNPVMNGLMDMTAANGSNLLTTTGASSVTGIAAAQVPYGWSLTAAAAINTAIGNGTATVSVGSEGGAGGFPRFWIEATGSVSSNSPITLTSGTMNGFAARVTAGDRVPVGARLRYAKHAGIGRFYGTVGVTLVLNIGATGGVTRASATGDQSVTQLVTRIIDGGAGMYLDDALLAEAGGALDLYRISPLLETQGIATFGSPVVNIIMNAVANVPFAWRLGAGQVQARRRNDVL